MLDVFYDSNDLQRRVTVDTDLHSLAERVLARPITLGHCAVDLDRVGRLCVVPLSEHPAPEQRYAHGPKVIRADDAIVGSRAVARAVGLNAFDYQPSPAVAWRQRKPGDRRRRFNTRQRLYARDHLLEK